MLAAFAVVFAAALIVFSVIFPLFSGAVQRSALGGIDRGLGFLFGVVRGAILVAIAFLVYERVIVSDPIPMVDDSRTAVVFAQLSESLEDQMPQDLPKWFQDRYNELIEKAQ